MHTTETIALLQVVAATDQRTVGEADIEVWDEALEAVTYDDARQAVGAYFATPHDRMLRPADLLAIIRTQRQDNAMRNTDAPCRCHPPGTALIGKPAWFDELAADTRLAARERWYDEHGQHRAYRNAPDNRPAGTR